MSTRFRPIIPLQIFHIVAAVGLLGADLALMVLGTAGARGWEPQRVYPAADMIVTWVIAPLAIAALITGVALGLTTKWGLFKHRWVTIKLAITVALSIVLLLVLVPGVSRAAQLALTAPQMVTDAQRIRFAIAPAVAATLLTLNVLLAMYKPPRPSR